MSVEQLAALAGTKIAFMYNDEARLIELEKVQPCKNQNVVVVGKDCDKQMAYRSFTLTKMSNILPIVD